MITSSSHARVYRRLGYLALAHAVAVFGLGFLLLSGGTENAWCLRLWVALVTLWFLWPVVLALHRGRSALRFIVFVSIAAVLLLPSLRSYSTMAPWTLGFPDGVTLNPLSSWQYFSAYRAGRAEAQRDVAAGVLAIEEYGLPGPGLAHYVRIMRDRNQIQVRRVAGCVVDEKILGHAAGYNEISEREIDRRVGRDRVDAAREEGAWLGEEEYAREEQYFKDLAKRLSSLPPDAKIAIESARAYLDQRPLNDPAAERELAELLHEVERCLIETVPEDAPSFKMRVTARSMPDTHPTFEVSAPGFFAPQTLWQTIYQNFETMSAPRWSRGSLSVAFDFAIRPPR